MRNNVHCKMILGFTLFARNTAHPPPPLGEVPLHAMTKAAVLLPLATDLRKTLGPPPQSPMAIGGFQCSLFGVSFFAFLCSIYCFFTAILEF